MANFLEFLKSGRSAKEFIDTAVLPRHILPVEHTGFSPEPYEPEPGESNTGDTDAVLDSVTEDRLTEPPGTGIDAEADPAFLSALEAAEREGIA